MKHKLVIGLIVLIAWHAFGVEPDAQEQPAGKQAENQAVEKVVDVEAARKPPKKKTARTSKLRAWTSSTGAELEAEFVELKYSRVVLKKADGELIQIALAGLSPEDQAFARELDRQQKTGGQVETEAKSPNRLPAYLDGDWKGYHSVYRHANFEAGVGSTGDLRIFLLEGGKRIGSSFTVSTRYQYTEKEKNRTRSRPVVEFLSFPKPAMQVKEVTFAGKLTDDVDFEYSFAFDGKEIRAWGHCVDPKDIQYPTRQYISFRAPASHTFPDDVTHAQIDSALQGHEVTIVPMSGKTTTYPYVKGVQNFVHPADTVSIKGGVYGPREIMLGAVTKKDAWLTPYIYRGYAPWRGYSVRLSKRKQDSTARTHCMSITID